MQTNHSLSVVRTFGAALFMGLAAILLVSCVQQDPAALEESREIKAELQQSREKIVALERDLAAARAEKEKLQTELSSAQKPVPAEPPTFARLSEDQMVDSLLASTKLMRSAMESGLPGYEIESYQLDKITMPPEVLRPYTTKATLALKAPDGVSLKVVVPLHADFSGKWSLPTVDEMRTLIEAARSGKTPEQNTAAGGATPSGERSRVPQMTPDGAIILGWPEDAVQPQSSASAPPSSGSAPLPAPQPSAPPPSASGPTKVMPVEKDVYIKFD